MNHRERVLSAFERRGYDRVPVKHKGTPEVNGISRARGMEEVLMDLADDFGYGFPFHRGDFLSHVGRQPFGSWRRHRYG